MISKNEFSSLAASSIKKLRLDRAWSQADLAERAGIKFATYQLFERTGQISLIRFIQLINALGREQDLLSMLEAFLSPERESNGFKRKRGKRKSSASKLLMQADSDRDFNVSFD